MGFVAVAVAGVVRESDVRGIDTVIDLATLHRPGYFYARSQQQLYQRLDDGMAQRCGPAANVTEACVLAGRWMAKR